ncbi:MAG: tetratricopeptide repeat protein [Candidatus Binatia bacterium]
MRIARRNRGLARIRATAGSERRAAHPARAALPACAAAGKADTGPAPPPWLWARWVDLTVGCAAWTLPLLAVIGWLARTRAADVALGFALLTLVCNHPHYAATIYRAFGNREAIAGHRRFYTVHLTLLAAVAVIAAHLFPRLAPLLFTAYVIWSPWHYTGQNLGVLLLFARRRQATPKAWERRLLRSAFVASYVVWLLMVNGTASTDPYVWSLELPRAVTVPAGIASAALFALPASIALAGMGGRAGWRAIVPCTVMLISQALWFVTPWLAQVVTNRSVSPVYYSTGVLAFFHCAQYLWITSYVARCERGAHNWRPWRYAGVIALGGIALFTAGPWLASTALGFDFRESVLIIVAVVNVHHFILDGAMWKLRDPRLAAVLLDRGAGPGAPPAPARAMPRRAAGWVAAAALVALAATNAFYDVITGGEAGTAHLELAARLNPGDSRIPVRRAEILAAAGQPDEALRALGDVAEPRPANAAAQRLYGTLLVATGRFADARDHYRALERSIGLDAQSLINVAVIAARNGELAEANTALEAALRLGPGSSAAHLNMAGLCMARADGACALRHYEAYLTSDEVARDRTYATAALNAASAAVLVQRSQLALELLQMSAAVAARVGARDLADLAATQAAALRAAPGAQQQASEHR